MNERLKYLALVSGFDWRIVGGQITSNNTRDDLKRFAQLIVSDILEIVEPCKCGCCDREQEGIIAETIMKQIMERFGVEE